MLFRSQKAQEEVHEQDLPEEVHEQEGDDEQEVRDKEMFQPGVQEDAHEQEEVREQAPGAREKVHEQVANNKQGMQEVREREGDDDDHEDGDDALAKVLARKRAIQLMVDKELDRVGAALDAFICRDAYQRLPPRAQQQLHFELHKEADAILNNFIWLLKKEKKLPARARLNLENTFEGNSYY